MKLKGVVFDMDGTLLDSMTAWEEYKRYIVTRTLGYYDKEINVTVATSREVIEELKNKHGKDLTSEDVERFAKEFLAPYYEKRACLKQGALDFLKTLSKHNVRMSVATATRREFFGNVFEKLGIESFFDAVITCTEVGKGKRDPLVFMEAIEKMGCDKEDVYVFEDSLIPIETCKKAGIKVCAVADSYNKDVWNEILKISDYSITSFDDFNNEDNLNNIFNLK